MLASAARTLAFSAASRALDAEGRSNAPSPSTLPQPARDRAWAVFTKLLLPDSEDHNRRVLAVLALIGH